MCVSGFVILAIVISALIVGIYFGMLPPCHGQYCLIDPLWVMYRYSFLSGFIVLVGIIFVGKGYKVQTPW